MILPALRLSDASIDLKLLVVNVKFSFLNLQIQNHYQSCWFFFVVHWIGYAEKSCKCCICFTNSIFISFLRKTFSHQQNKMKKLKLTLLALTESENATVRVAAVNALRDIVLKFGPIVPSLSQDANINAIDDDENSGNCVLRLLFSRFNIKCSS